MNPPPENLQMHLASQRPDNMRERQLLVPQCCIHALKYVPRLLGARSVRVRGVDVGQ